MDIKALRYFVGIAEAGSILRASERLHVAQPALSVNLANLEADLGVKLMERTSRGSKLTPDGLVLYNKAKALLSQYQETINCLKGREDRPSGRVSVGLASSTSFLIGSELYRRVRDQYPDIRLYLTDAGSASLYEWLNDRRIDFALLFSLPDDLRFNAIPLHDEEFYLVSRAELASNEDEVAFERIFDLPLVLTCQSTAWRQIVDEVAARHGKVVDPLVETESINVIRSIVLSGEASSIVPLSYVRAEVDRGELKAQRLTKPNFRGSVSLVNLNAVALSSAQIAVQQMIIDVVRNRKEFDSGNVSMMPWTETPRTLPGTVLPMGGRWRAGRFRPARVGNGSEASFN